MTWLPLSDCLHRAQTCSDLMVAVSCPLDELAGPCPAWAPFEQQLAATGGGVTPYTMMPPLAMRVAMATTAASSNDDDHTLTVRTFAII